MATWLYKIDKI